MELVQEIEEELAQEEMDYLDDEALAEQGIDLEEEKFIRKQMSKAQT